jgi:hypothetical protein
MCELPHLEADHDVNDLPGQRCRETAEYVAGEIRVAERLARRRLGTGAVQLRE